VHLRVNLKIRGVCADDGWHRYEASQGELARAELSVAVPRVVGMPAPIVLVPGFWLGAWAWDEVARLLRADGHNVTALTLPGMDPADPHRSEATLTDQVDAICAALTAAPGPAVLAVHSGSGTPGYVASDRMPDKIATMAYVDSGPGIIALRPGFDGADLPLPPRAEFDENLDGIPEERLVEFWARAVPEPGGVLREVPQLTNDARRDVPSVVICTSVTSDWIQAAAKEGQPWLAGLLELRNVTYADLPTSHWPMWSKPRELADLLGRLARSAAA
jgi:hypothetical protein